MTKDLLSELVALEKKATPVKWEFYWRVDDDKHADCGIFSEQRKGHAISVCRAPRYEKRQQWEANAALISALRNAFPAIVSALSERDRVRKEAMEDRRDAERLDWLNTAAGRAFVCTRNIDYTDWRSRIDAARSLIAPPAEKRVSL